MSKVRSTLSLAEGRAEHALSHELPYWEFSGNVAVLAEGSLVKALRLKGRNIETLDADSLNRITVDIRSMLNSLSDECEISFVVDTNSDCEEVLNRHFARRSEESNIALVAKSRADQLRAAVDSGDIIQTNLYLFVYLRPDGDQELSTSGLFRKFFAPPQSFRSIAHDVFKKRVGQLEQLTISLIHALGTVSIGAREIDQDSLRNIIYRFLNPGMPRNRPAPKASQAHRLQEFSPSELAVVPELSISSPREQLVGSDLILDRNSFEIGGIHHGIISLKTLPEFTNSCLIAKLLGLPFNFQLHCHLKVPRQSAELSQLQAKRRMAHSMSMSQGGRATDLDSESQLNSTEELLRDLINSGQKIMYAQITILLRCADKDELEIQTKSVLAKFREINGAEGLAESLAAFPLWKTTLPCGTTTTLRSKRIKVDNLADLLPIYEDYSGDGIDPVCLFRNRAGGLVAYDPFDSKRLTNFNALFTGSSGAGKSFLNNLILLQYMSQNPKVYVVDVGGSYRKLCEFFGGQYVEIAPPTDGEGVAAINPFLLAPGETQPSPRKLKLLLAMLESILAENGKQLSKLERSLLEETLIQVYEKTVCVPTLSDLAVILANSEQPVLQTFSKILFPWTGMRPYGRMLDQKGGLNLNSDFVVFDLKGLSAYPDLQSVMLLIITDFILGNVENGELRHRRKQIVMDECWELLKSPASSSFMEYCVRTLRKSGSGITFITQGLDELIANPIGGTIIANCATKFVLLQRGDLEPVQKILKLNDQEMALIGSLRQRKGVYSEAFMIFNEDRSVVRAVPSSIEYWLATSDPLDNSALDLERAKGSRSLREAIVLAAEKYPHGYANGIQERSAA